MEIKLNFHKKILDFTSFDFFENTSAEAASNSSGKNPVIQKTTKKNKGFNLFLFSKICCCLFLSTKFWTGYCGLLMFFKIICAFYAVSLFIRRNWLAIKKQNLQYKLWEWHEQISNQNCSKWFYDKHHLVLIHFDLNQSYL